jgi:hypothetical protein
MFQKFLLFLMLNIGAQGWSHGIASALRAFAMTALLDD